MPGFNELSYKDEKGREEVVILAQHGRAEKHDITILIEWTIIMLILLVIIIYYQWKIKVILTQNERLF
ncbi:hypothetical protein PEB0122_022310 [Bartonella apis]|nr:hypothetical protein PEB0122_022310 [Bartonella apis]